MKNLLKTCWLWYRRRRRVTRILMYFMLVLFIVLFFASSIAKWYINANGEELSGRKLHLNDLSFNYLTFSATAEDFVMYEVNKKDTFIHLGAAYLNMNPWKLLGGEYELSALHLDKMKLNIIRKDSLFNFSDLDSDEPSDSKAEPTKFYLSDIKITNSSITYVDSNVQAEFPLRNLNASIEKWGWNDKSNTVLLDFTLGHKGKVNLGFDINNFEGLYSLDLKTSFVRLDLGLPYIKDYFNIQSLDGYLFADVTFNGSIDDPMKISSHGKTSITKMAIIDSQSQALTSVDSIAVTVDSINIKKMYFSFSETYLKKPVVHASITKVSTNFDYLLAPLYALDSQSETQLASQVSNLSDSALTIEASPFHFAIQKIVIEEGIIHYTDLRVNRPFTYSMTGINVKADNLANDSRNLKATFAMVPNGQGTIVGTAIIDLVIPNNISVNMALKNLDMISFSPYSEYYVGAPIMQGTFNYEIDLMMSMTNMNNNNRFDIRELEFGNKVQFDSAYKLPLKLALVLMKDKNDNIQFDIPVTGNPSDPNFRLMPIIWKTFSNFIVKVASSPMALVASAVGKNPEDQDKLFFDYGQSSLSGAQKETLDKIVAIQKKKGELFFSFVQMSNPVEEKQAMAILAIKKQYSPSDWRNVADKDPDFVAFVDARASGGTLGEKCAKHVGAGTLDSQWNVLLTSRNAVVKEYLFGLSMPATAFEIKTADMQNMAAQQLKRPFFKIEVGVR